MTQVESFQEEFYLSQYPDVREAVMNGQFASAYQHYELFGRSEGRLVCAIDLSDERGRKLAKLQPLLNLAMPHVVRAQKYDFLTEELRQETGIIDTNAVSSNNYDDTSLALIEKYKAGLILDCGAGRRSIYYENVVNFEIVDYDTTDIIGVGEHLPFLDDSFDAVISIAVLEHVRDPFKCAAEIVRVLKPGGELVCCVPFLQPLHGYPHHYYNMSHQGLRALFDRALTIDDQKVVNSILPIWSLTWFLSSWVAGLSGEAREKFMTMKVADLVGNPVDYLSEDWVRGLSPEKNFELASATMLLAHKPKE